MSQSSGPHASEFSSQAQYPTQFGRGWIPADRDIGLPDDDPYDGDPPPRPIGGVESEWWCPKAGGPCRKPAPNESEEFVPHHAWDAARKVRFLHYLAEKGDVRAAAASAGMSRQSAYMLRRRDPVFAQGWAAALVLARQHAEEVLATRAIDGVEEAIWFRGELVGMRRRYDSRLLLAHLARLDALTETVAGEQAERFDEVLALVAGEAPDPSFFRASPFPNEPDPLLPLGREEYAESAAALACAAEHEEWEEAYHNLEAEKEDEPQPDYHGYHAAFLRGWDEWRDHAFATADGAVAAPGSRADREGGDDEGGEGHAAAGTSPVVPAQAGTRPDSHLGSEGGGSEPPIEYKSLGGPGSGLPLDCVNRVNLSTRRSSCTVGRVATIGRERNARLAVCGGKVGAARPHHPPPVAAPAGLSS